MTYIGRVQLLEPLMPSGMGVPQVLSAQVIDEWNLTVHFSETMRTVGAEGANDVLNPANYSFDADISVVAVVLVQQAPTVVALTITPGLVNNQAYTVTVDNVKSSQNILIDPLANSAPFTGVASAPQVTNALVRDTSTIRVMFSKRMANNTELVNASNYTFAGAATLTANAVAVVPNSNDTAVDITVNQEMNNGGAYVVYVATTMQDYSGNLLDPAYHTAQFTGVGVLPTVLLAEGRQASKFWLMFSEEVKSVEASNKDNYLVVDENLVTLEVIGIEQLNATTYEFTTEEQSSSKTYTVITTPTAVHDWANNPIDPTHNTATFRGVGYSPPIIEISPVDGTGNLQPRSFIRVRVADIAYEFTGIDRASWWVRVAYPDVVTGKTITLSVIEAGQLVPFFEGFFEGDPLTLDGLKVSFRPVGGTWSANTTYTISSYVEDNEGTPNTNSNYQVGRVTTKAYECYEDMPAVLTDIEYKILSGARGVFCNRLRKLMLVSCSKSTTQAVRARTILHLANSTDLRPAIVGLVDFSVINSTTVCDRNSTLEILQTLLSQEPLVLNCIDELGLSDTAKTLFMDAWQSRSPVYAVCIAAIIVVISAVGVVPLKKKTTSVEPTLPEPPQENRPPVPMVQPLSSHYTATSTYGAVVRVDGSQSYDPDLDPITYAWYDGDANISNSSVSNLRLAVGTHHLTLQVRDTHGAVGVSAPITVVIDALPNQAPIADAAPLAAHITATDYTGKIVTLDGSDSSDPDNDPLTYAWYDFGVLIATGVTPAPKLAVGDHQLVLTVDDGRGGTDSTSVMYVTIDEPANSPPVALSQPLLTEYVIPYDETVAPLFLDGSQSYDPDNDVLQFVWRDGGTVIANTPTATVDFDEGQHSITLTVTDEHSASDVTTAQVFTVAPPPNRAPTAVPNQFVSSYQAPDVNGYTLSLDGAQSFDPDNDALTYQWKDGQTVIASTATADVLLTVGQHSITLTVNDGRGGSHISAAQAVEILSPPNHAPVAVMNTLTSPVVMLVPEGYTVSLSGAASSDPDDDDLTYEWLVNDIPVATGVTHDLLLLEGEYQISLRVTDEHGLQNTCTAQELVVQHMVVTDLWLSEASILSIPQAEDLPAPYDITKYGYQGAEASLQTLDYGINRVLQTSSGVAFALRGWGYAVTPVEPPVEEESIDFDLGTASYKSTLIRGYNVVPKMLENVDANKLMWNKHIPVGMRAATTDARDLVMRFGSSGAAGTATINVRVIIRSQTGAILLTQSVSKTLSLTADIQQVVIFDTSAWAYSSSDNISVLLCRYGSPDTLVGDVLYYGGNLQKVGA